jgi:hypothetical protein
VFPEEVEAFEQVRFLKWVIPLFVTLAWFLDCLLVILFHWFFHPWVSILKEDTKGDRERILKQAREIIDVDMSNEKVLEFIRTNLDIANNVLQNPNTAKFVRSVMSMSEDDKKDMMDALTIENVKVKEKLHEELKNRYANSVWSKYV